MGAPPTNALDTAPLSIGADVYMLQLSSTISTVTTSDGRCTSLTCSLLQKDA